MDKAKNLKRVDKIIGTPLCYILGFFSKIGRLWPRPPAAGPRRILCIKTVAIGDLVVAAPAFRALRRAYPGARMVLLTTPRVREVVEGSPDFDEIIYYDVQGRDRGLAGLVKLVRLVRSGRYDLVVDFEHYYRFTTLIAWLSGARQRVGFKLSGQGRAGLFTRATAYPVDKHEVEAFLALAAAAGGQVGKPEAVAVPTTAADEEAVDRFFRENELSGAGTLIGIHTGTSPVAQGRRWPAERFAALADQLTGDYGAVVIFTGAPDDFAGIEEIRARMSRRSVSAAGELTLKQFACLTKRLNLFISLDTGPMHIAAAMGAKVIGLFGPNTPVKWGPYGAGNIGIYKELDCSPCTKQYLGRVSGCQTGECMLAIEVGEVAAAAARLLRPADDDAKVGNM